MTGQAIEPTVDRYNLFLLCFDAPDRSRLRRTTQQA